MAKNQGSGQRDAVTVDPEVDLEKALAKFAKWLGALVDDATTVEVQTIVPSDPTKGLPGKWENNRFVPSMDNALVVKALTRIRFDGDTVQLIPTRPDGTIDEPINNVHKDAVKAAHDYRASVLSAIGTLVGGLFKKR